jgi:hypothetical protein
MGTSFVEYRGRGFWTRDAKIEVWLCLLAHSARESTESSDWLRGAAEHWHLQGTVGFMGCVSPDLDVHAATPERARSIIELATQTIAALRARGEIATASWLNSLGAGGSGSEFGQDVPIETFTRVGEAFIALLRGEIEWDASTSPTI